MTATTTNAPAAVAPSKPRSKRRGLMVALPVVLLLAGGAYLSLIHISEPTRPY